MDRQLGTPAVPHGTARQDHDPAHGPRLLFFSGGTAMNPVAAELKHFTHNSIHLLSPFDSGGSSGILRRHLPMPAVGDLRSRLLTLVDDRDPSSRALRKVLAYRFADTGPALPLAHHLSAKTHELLEQQRGLLRDQVASELLRMLDSLSAPSDLDLRGASLGNLALTAAYQHNQRSLQAATRWLRSLLTINGEAYCTVEADLHLVARLESGDIISGQHRITGKEAAPIRSRIEATWLASTDETPLDNAIEIAPDLARLIEQAELIVYAPGSFHSSLMVHFLVNGVSSAIARCQAPKVYIPNLGADPELFGTNPMQAFAELSSRLGQSSGAETTQLLTHVLIDESQRNDFATLTGPDLIVGNIRKDDGHHHDPQALSKALCALALQR